MSRLSSLPPSELLGQASRSITVAAVSDYFDERPSMLPTSGPYHSLASEYSEPWQPRDVSADPFASIPPLHQATFYVYSSLADRFDKPASSLVDGVLSGECPSLLGTWLPCASQAKLECLLVTTPTVVLQYEHLGRPGLGTLTNTAERHSRLGCRCSGSRDDKPD